MIEVRERRAARRQRQSSERREGAARHPIEDRDLVAALRSGDETALTGLVDLHYPAMIRVARCSVPDDPTAEQVVTEAWTTAIASLDEFEGPSLKLWLFRIVDDTAAARSAGRPRPGERRAADLRESDGPAGADRFYPEGHELAGRWRKAPAPWGAREADRLSEPATRAVINRTIAGLPDTVCKAVTLRDGEGWPVDEVGALLAVGDSDLRSMLHEARSAVHAALTGHLAAA